MFRNYINGKQNKKGAVSQNGTKVNVQGKADKSQQMRQNSSLQSS